MSLVDKDDMTTLRTAAESLATSQTAEDEIQLKAVAYAINSAANTGETVTVFQGELRENVKSEVEGKGYTIRYDSSIAFPDRKAIISWK